MKDFHYYRHQHIFQNLLKKIPSLTDLKVLDIGCNEGYYSFVAKDLGAAYVKGIDLRDTNISRANKIKEYFGYNNCEFIKGDISAADFHLNESFDIVFCLGVLYHLENPMLVIRKLRSMTKDLLIVDSALTSFDMTPFLTIYSETTQNLRAGATGIAIYPTLGALINLLQCAGFSVEKIPPTHPPFWAPDCPHDYNRNQITLICK